MESSSHFQWINNEDLEQSIYRYYDETEYFSDVTKNNVIFSDNRMEDFVFSTMEISSYWPGANPYSQENPNSKLNNTDLMRNNNLIENLLIGRNIRAMGEIESAQNTIRESQKLIEKINAYLENN